MSRRAPFVLIAASLGVRLVLALGTELYPDEAYYWAWSRAPQLSYFDHPAMVAWAIGLLGIRLSAAAFGLLTLFGAWRLARAAGASIDAAWWAVALVSTSPAAVLLGTFATPDAPMLAFWLLTLDGVLRKSPWQTGLCWGLALLSKYNGALLGLPILVGFWRTPSRWLIAGVLASAVSAPTFVWNAQHDWVGFRFQLDHGLGGGGGLATFGAFLAGQLAMAGPVLFALCVLWLVRYRRPAVLVVATVLPLVLFGIAALRARGEANWAAAAWLTAAIGASTLPWTRWFQIAASLNLALGAIGAVLITFPPEALLRTPVVRRLHGWEQLSLARTEQGPVFTDRYQLSALVTRYAGLEATTFEGRRSQYDLWPAPQVRPGADALWISEHRDPPDGLKARFERVEPITWPLTERQRALHELHVWRLVHARPQ